LFILEEGQSYRKKKMVSVLHILFITDVVVVAADF
jgi:hypothetical protein